MEFSFNIDIIPVVIRTSTPILLAALGGLICHKAGVFNIGLEGFMLTGSFVTIAVAHATGNNWISILAAALSATILCLLMALISIKFRANIIIVGLGVNLLALGLTTYLLEGFLGSTGSFISPNIKPISRVTLPFIDSQSSLANMLSFAPMVYIAFLLVIVMYLFLYFTKTGLSIRLVGEHPSAAKSAGINIILHKYIAMGLCGFLCGLAGAHLSLGYVTMFTENMTAGRGFIAFTAIIFANGHPLGVMLASLFFGWTDAIGMRAQLVGFQFPTEFIQAIPYVLTIIALVVAAFFQRSRMQYEVFSETIVQPDED